MYSGCTIVRTLVKGVFYAAGIRSHGIVRHVVQKKHEKDLELNK